MGGASIHEDNDGGDGGDRIVPTLRIGVDGKIVVDESRYVHSERWRERMSERGRV